VSDASGHYSSGYFWGNTFWLGSKSLCNELSEYEKELPFKLGFNIIKTYIALQAPINYTVNMNIPCFMLHKHILYLQQKQEH
jgi:hypothetical protein